MLHNADQARRPSSNSLALFATCPVTGAWFNHRSGGLEELSFTAHSQLSRLVYWKIQAQRGQFVPSYSPVSGLDIFLL